MLIAVVAVPTALLVLLGISEITDVHVFALNAATMLGLGLAVDYALLIVTRFREELGRGLDVDAALDRTRKTAGLAILVSGGTVAVSMAGLLAFPIMVLKSIAVSGMVRFRLSSDSRRPLRTSSKRLPSGTISTWRRTASLSSLP